MDDAACPTKRSKSLMKIINTISHLNNHVDSQADQRLLSSGDEESVAFSQKRLSFEGLSGGEQPRFMAGLFLVLVLLLHCKLILWLLKPVDVIKNPELLIMEVSLVSTPGQKSEIMPVAAPSKPEPLKKEPTKKKEPVKKKIPVFSKKAELLKQEELPKPQPSVEQTPSTSEAPVSTPQSVSRTAPAEVSSIPTISSGVIPLERVPPKYPISAANRHIEGWVKVEFTITTSGTVKDASVVEAEPAEIFNGAALKAILQWRFKEKIINGVAVEQRAVQRLQFKLTESE